MKLIISLLSIISLACAGYPPPPGPWTLGAWRPPTDPPAPVWLGRAIQANQGKLWIGKPASSWCDPSLMSIDCSLYRGDSTVFKGGNDTVFLDVLNPNGQQIYINKTDGALTYTWPGMFVAPKEPEVIYTGWTREISVSGGAPIVLSYKNRPVLACPTASANLTDVYQIFVQLNAAPPSSSCVTFQLRTYAAEGIVAWSY
ncbi:hypothetical protein B0T22DRAFT_513787 [Podospora appendiculata]|uniref:Uncharacterized protein n=1 Tax=Podospora appendiculata TaxID=314037 RepID=A0AAE1CDG1_9PEZI|nr:hypothetical protein B0T22DRAFT_513787 [Podospora appendiculata]